MGIYAITQTVPDDPSGWSGKHFVFLVKAASIEQARELGNAMAQRNGRPTLDKFDTIEKVSFMAGLFIIGEFGYGD